MDLLNFLFLDSLYEFFNPKKRIFIGYLLIAIFIAVVWLVYFRKLNLREAINKIFDKNKDIFNCYIANDNSVGQIVISGNNKDLEKFSIELLNKYAILFIF